MKKITLLFLSFVLALLSFSFSFAEAKPSISSEAGILLDYESGKILYGKNIHKKMYPASTTKVMTALLTLERANLSDRVIIDYDLGYIDGSSMFLKKGEIFTVEELLKVLLIRSANDVAVVLANHISGSTEEFAKLMNKRAKELGAKETHFANPNGLPDPNHYTSAYDLALIAREAMKHEKFREIVKTPFIKIPPTMETPETRTFRNSNRLLWGIGGRNTMEYKGKIINIKYDLVDGIKTGFTNVARQCLISSGEKNDFRLISVVLKSEGKNVYIDTRTLLDYGFDNYTAEKIIYKEEVAGSKKVPLSKEKVVNYGPTKDFHVLLKNDEDIQNIKKKIILQEDLNAPIEKGEIIGKMEIYDNKKKIGKVNLMALNSITPTFIKYPILNKFKTIFLSFIKILLIIFILFLFIVGIKKKKRKRNRVYR